MSRSDFPSFDEFLSRYTEEDIIRWSRGAQEIADQRPIQLPLDESNVHNFATTLCAMNFPIMLAILREYHEWLCEQLDQRSLRLL